jgi:hypothetical protein
VGEMKGYNRFVEYHAICYSEIQRYKEIHKKREYRPGYAHRCMLRHTRTPTERASREKKRKSFAILERIKDILIGESVAKKIKIIQLKVCEARRPRKSSGKIIDFPWVIPGLCLLIFVFGYGRVRRG